jgi:transcription initiation factor TFIIIB Brf1 subunit/transcription initiation factor TFIIB
MSSPNTSCLDSIWKDLDSLKNDQITTNEITTNNYNNSNIQCKSCNSTNIYITQSEFVCNDCGLVNNKIFSSTVFLNNDVEFSKPKNINYNNQFSKIQKMQEWFLWTNEEKNSYKLTNYTKELCSKLNITEILIPIICKVVNVVMDAIKKYDGTKRARVKDGIILSCIQYVADDNNLNISICELAKKINLDIKYVTRADRIILELINNQKLNLKKNTVQNIKTPIEYILATINNYKLEIPDIIIKKLKALIKFCETNDILLDHTPLSIGVCCFYYVLKTNNIDINIKTFATMYDLSIVTILKTFNKLNIHSNVIQKYLSKI